MYCFFVQWNWVYTVSNYAGWWYSCTQFFCMQMSGHFQAPAASCQRRWCPITSGRELGQARSWSGCSVEENNNLCPIWEWTVVIHAIALAYFCTLRFLKLLFTREFLQSDGYHCSFYEWLKPMLEKSLCLVIEIVSENLSLCIYMPSHCIKRTCCWFPIRVPPPTVHSPNTHHWIPKSQELKWPFH